LRGERRGGVGVGYYWGCALGIDAAKMCSSDAVVFLRCCAISVVVVVLLLQYGNYICLARYLKFW
jgi:hypothetical protein